MTKKYPLALLFALCLCLLWAVSLVMRAANTITSAQTIPEKTNVLYQAGKNISLQGTFQTQSGSVFKAGIKGCDSITLHKKS